VSNAIVTGTVEGTGSAINVSIGFVPRVVIAYNIDDAGTDMPLVLWTTNDADAAGVKILASAIAYISSDGISEYDGSSTVGSEASPGFTIGADSDLNASGETINYIAFR
jgi:hypothetical protein